MATAPLQVLAQLLEKAGVPATRSLALWISRCARQLTALHRVKRNDFGECKIGAFMGTTLRKNELLRCQPTKGSLSCSPTGGGAQKARREPSGNARYIARARLTIY